MNLILEESAHISQWLWFVHQKVNTNNLKYELKKIFFYFTGKLKEKSITDLILFKYGYVCSVVVTTNLSFCEEAKGTLFWVRMH